jgi:transposase
MLGPPKESHRDELFLDSFEQRLPASNFYRKLDATLDLSFVRDWVADKYAAIGRPSIDPVVFFKLELILFFDGLRSERLLMEMADLNIAQRWYLGYGWAEPLPDHSSLTKIRQRLGLETFQRVFDRVVELCQDVGLVWGRELIFDGTKVRANADIDSLTPRFAQAAREHVSELFRGDAAADATPSSEPASGETVPVATTPAQEGVTPGAVAVDAGAMGPVDQPDDGGMRPLSRSFSGDAATDLRLAAENQAQWKLLEEHRLDPKRQPSGAPGGYRRITDFRVSTTDPDATPLNTSESGKLGYHDQYVVDGGKARIIVGVLVTPADVQDNQAFLDVLDRARFRFQLPVKRAIADSKFATIENLCALEQRGIRAYMPIVEDRKHGRFFSQHDFAYDRETDSYCCPQGETLRHVKTDYSKGIDIYEAPERACAACPVRERCTDGMWARHVTRPFAEDMRERNRELQTTEAYKKAMRKRQVWVEPLFGEAKEWHQLRRFLLRGLVNVNMQALLVATGQNLKRYIAATTRGQRPAQAQRAVVRFHAWWRHRRRSGCRPIRHFQRAG